MNCFPPVRNRNTWSFYPVRNPESALAVLGTLGHDQSAVSNTSLSPKITGIAFPPKV